MLNKFLSAPYRDGGRGLLPSIAGGCVLRCAISYWDYRCCLAWGAVGKDRIRENTHAYRELKKGMDECARNSRHRCGFRGKACLHVGVVVEADGRLKVLDTNPGGARIRTVPEFETDFQGWSSTVIEFSRTRWPTRHRWPRTGLIAA